MSIQNVPSILMDDTDIILYINLKAKNGSLHRRVLRRIPIDVIDRKVVKNFRKTREKKDPYFVWIPGAEIDILGYPIDEKDLDNAKLYAYGLDKAVRGEITLDKLQKLTEPLMELPVAAKALESYFNLNIPDSLPTYGKANNVIRNNKKSAIISKFNFNKNVNLKNVHNEIKINNNNNFSIRNRTKYSKSKRPSKVSKLTLKYTPNNKLRNIMRRKNITRKLLHEE
jgi:hypothetical protein